MSAVRYTLTADPRDVLSVKSTSGQDLIEALIKVVRGVGGSTEGVVEGRSFNSVTLSFPPESAPAREVIEEAGKKLCRELKIRDVHISESASESAAPGAASDPAPQAAPAAPAAEPAPARQKKKPYEEILSLVGAEEIKAWAAKIDALPDPAPDPAARAAALTGMGYLLAVDPGNGCSTILRLMGRLLAEKLGRRDVKVNESFLEFKEDRDGLRPLEEHVEMLREGAEHGKLYLFALHLDAYLSRLHTHRFTEFLRKLRKAGDLAAFVFVVPYLEDGVLHRIKQDLQDTTVVRTLRVRPYSDSDLICFFERYFSERGKSVSRESHAYLLKKVAAEKRDGRFYGPDTVEKIGDEILYEKITGGRDSDTVTPDDVAAVLPEEAFDDGTPGLVQLEKLVALQQVKDKVRELCATIRFEKQNEKGRPRSMHMMFSGAPGTGKTAVARILGKILKEEGVLARGEFYEVTRKDLVGQYVGHTAPKTAEVCRMAYDSVLFIDEAYALADGSDRDYGKEAVSTLIAEMENHRDRLIVIFAGYEKELEKLFDMNPGLRDRVPHHVHFPNYSREELRDIFFTMIPAAFRYGDDFRECASRYFLGLSDEVMKSETFSNARFVRNVMERVISKASLRLFDAESEGGAVLLLPSDFELAVADAEFRDLAAKKRPVIGF